jgi:hypothetical protein
MQGGTPLSSRRVCGLCRGIREPFTADEICLLTIVIARGLIGLLPSVTDRDRLAGIWIGGRLDRHLLT